MHISMSLKIDGYAVFMGEVQGVHQLDEGIMAIQDSIFAELSKHLDCTSLVVNGMTWDQYNARRIAASAKEIV